MSVKLLTEHHLEFLSLKGGCSSSFEFTLVKMPHCWKYHGSFINFMTKAVKSIKQHLSHRQAVKDQVTLHILAGLPEPLLLAYTKYGYR